MAAQGNFEAYLAMSAEASAAENETKRLIRRMDRCYDRVLKWASTREKEDVARYLAALLLLRPAENKSARTKYKVMMEMLCEYEAKIQKKHQDLQLGGYRAHAEKKRAKEKAKKLWKERHEGRHPKLRRNEDFAMEVMRLWPVLKSVGTILSWCTAWNKEVNPNPLAD